MNSVRPWLAAALMSLTAVGSAALGDPPDEGRRGRLDLPGGLIAGTLAPVPESDRGTRDTFLWKSPHFSRPLEFFVGEVAGITYPTGPAADAPAGQSVHLRGGDVIAASIESLDADALVVSIGGPAGPQRLRIARAEVAAIVRNGGGGGGYMGPSGLEGWQQAPGNSWREEAGRVATDKAGAAVTRDVAAPARARYAIELTGLPTSEFRLAVAAAERPADDGYVLQAVGDDDGRELMLVRRAGGRATIEPLPTPPLKDGVLRIVLFVDQASGRFAALLPDLADGKGPKVVEVTLPAAAGGKESGRFRLELTGGTIGLDKLEVTPWRGEQPTLRDAAATTVVSRGGVLEGFEVTSFDATRGEYVFSRGDERKQVAAADVDEIRFPDGADEAAEEASLQLRQADGSVLSGDLVKVDDRAVWLRRRGIDTAVGVPIASLATIRGRRLKAPREESPGRLGTLTVGDDRVRGRLVGDAAAPGGIAWKPLGSLNAVALAGAPFDAEVEYAPRRAGPKVNAFELGGIGGQVNVDDAGFCVVVMLVDDGAAAQDGRLQVGDRINAIAPTAKSRFVETKDLDTDTVMNLLRGRVGTALRLRVTDGGGANPRDIDLIRQPITADGRESRDAVLKAEATHLRLAGPVEPEVGQASVIVLRSGDVAPCQIESIDEKVVVLRTPLAAGGDAASLRVPGELVKAIELMPAASSGIISKTLVERLLTIPRMQRDRPPTHILRLTNSDYLRGRLVGVDDKTVTIEVLETVKQLPRPQVARIIWLHPEIPKAGDKGQDDAGNEDEDENEEENKDGAIGPQESAAPLVQGVSPEGRRMTLVAEGVEGNRLRGQSRAFGGSGIDLTQIDRLLIGEAIERDAGKVPLPYAQWKVKPAAEPRALAKPAEQ
jgi:hypothetical protein